MANLDDYAFGAMNNADPEKDITGGAMFYSEFEMAMTPKQQQQYRSTVLGTLDSVYRHDPNKGRLNFSDWLDNLKPEVVRERALEWEKVRHDKDTMDKMDPKEFKVIEDAGFLEGLLQKHTGRLQDVRDIIGSEIPRPIEEFQPTPTELRR